MENPIKRIVKFNEDAGLLEKGYDDFLESSFQIEEALEGFKHHNVLCEQMNADPSLNPKEISRDIVAMCMGVTKENPNGVHTSISDVDRFDKAIDAVVFAVGSMAKLGLNAQQIGRGINAVMRANNQKLQMPKDKFGKLQKPADFVGPEPELQRILNERIR